MAATENLSGTGFTPSEGHVLCEDCNGTGSQSCEDCGGDGTVIHQCDRGYDHEESCSCEDGHVDCFNCDGQGEVLDEDLELDPTL